MNSNKRLYRSDEPIFVGVCGGIAEYFEIDPTLIRILTVVLCLAGFGFPVIAYFIAMIIMPKRSADSMEYIDVKPTSTGQAESSNTGSAPFVSSAKYTEHAEHAEYAPPGRAYTTANPQAYDVCGNSDPSYANPNETMRRGIRASIIFGILLVVIGLMALLATFLNIMILNFWPMIFIVWGLIALFTPSKKGWSLSRAGNAIALITVGFVLQLWALGFFNFGTFGRVLVSLWPVLFVILGLIIIGSATRKSVFTLFGSLLFSLALLFGVWSYGQMQSYTLTIPLPWSQNRPLSINTAASPNSGETDQETESQDFVPKPFLVPQDSSDSNKSD